MATLRVRQIRTNATTRLKATIPSHIDEALSMYTTAYNAEYNTEVKKEELLPHILETFFLEDKAFQSFLKKNRASANAAISTSGDPAPAEFAKPRVELAQVGASAAVGKPGATPAVVHPVKIQHPHKQTEQTTHPASYQAPAPRFVDMG